jgi:hypothetical protein
MWWRLTACALVALLAGCQTGEMHHANESQHFLLDSADSFWNRPGDGGAPGK